MKRAIDQVRFVRVWTSAKSLVDVARRMKMSTRSATAMASRLRAGDVDLKKFKTGTTRTHASTLNAVIKKTR